ncbi:MAG TPA: hypothetical protein VHO94_01375 [Oscillospiraceae bacterium]|nr:hypothetical protein [Oscillospiraceae bacterium]
MSNKKTANWNRLDNAAKIFPPTSDKRDTKVFRFACELYETVELLPLQLALDKTIELFPSFQCILKGGLFWYYLESCDIKPTVKAESNPPCSTIYDRNVKGLLFEVTYFQNRINLEVYHALTDGTGALQFLRSLVFHYLVLQHASDFKEQIPVFDYDASTAQKSDDSFQKYYSQKKKGVKEKHVNAYKLNGLRVSENRIKVIEGTMSVKSVLNEAHKYHTTLTVFLAALLVCSIQQEMKERDRKRPVVLTVPVNLRNYFSSQTTRNFFSIINVGYDFSENSDKFEDVIASLQRSFERELNLERLSERLNKLAALEHNIFTRAVPRVIKDIVLKMASDSADKEVTASLSNIGKVTMPAELANYVRMFDVFVSTEKLQICMCSYGDALTVSFTSPLLSAEIQKHFFRSLTEMGIAVEIAANKMDDE